MRLSQIVSKGALLTGLIFGAVVISPGAALADHASMDGSLGGSGERQAASVAEKPEIEIHANERLIVVQGTGSIAVRPDSIRVTVGAQAQATTLEAARGEVNQRMNAVNAALLALNIPKLSLQTSLLRFDPIYGEAKNNELPKIIGYNASNEVVATLLERPVSELSERAARIVDTALDAGANTVGGISFFLHDDGEAHVQALEKAVENAQRTASVVADAAGLNITGVAWVEVISSEGGSLDYSKGAFMEAALGSTPIEVGEMTVERTVSVKFTFAPKP